MGEFSIRSVVGSRGSGEGLRSVAEVEPSNDLLTRVTGLAGARVGGCLVRISSVGFGVVGAGFSAKLAGMGLPP